MNISLAFTAAPTRPSRLDMCSKAPPSGPSSSARATSPVPNRIIGQPRDNVVTTISPLEPCGSGNPETGSQIST